MVVYKHTYGIGFCFVTPTKQEGTKYGPPSFEGPGRCQLNTVEVPLMEHSNPFPLHVTNIKNSNMTSNYTMSEMTLL